MDRTPSSRSRGRRRWAGGWGGSCSTPSGRSRSRASYAGSARCSRWTSRSPSSPCGPGVRRRDPGELAEALADGEVIKAFAFRGSMHYLSPEDGGIYLALRAAGRQWELPSWVEHYRLAPADWPDFRAAVRRRSTDGPLTVGELGEAVTARPGLPAPGAGLRRGRGHAGQAADLAGRHGLRAAARRAGTPSSGSTPTRAGAASPTSTTPGPRAILAYLRTYGPATLEHLHYWLGDGLSAGRRRLDALVRRARRPAGRGRRRGHRGVRRARGRRRAARGRAPSEAVRFLPGHDQWVMGPAPRTSTSPRPPAAT